MKCGVSAIAGYRSSVLRDSCADPARHILHSLVLTVMSKNILQCSDTRSAPRLHLLNKTLFCRLQLGGAGWEAE